MRSPVLALRNSTGEAETGLRGRVEEGEAGRDIVEIAWIVRSKNISLGLVNGNGPVVTMTSKRTVLQSRQPGIGRPMAIVTREEMAERLVHAFVQQQPHQTCASRRLLHSSNTCNTSSRLTVGNPVKKSSSESPPSR